MAKIQIDQVEANSVVLLQGVVAFSRIASRIEGEELEQEKERRRARGQHIMPSGPYTQISIHSVELIAADPNNLSLAEQYVSGRCYASKNAERNPGMSFTAENKSRYLPAVGVLNADGSYTQVYPTGELEAGQKVILVLRIYESRMGHGLGLDAVLVQSPDIQYRGTAGGSQVTSELAARGIVWHSTPNPADEVTPDEMAERIANTQPLQQTAAPVAVAQPTETPVAAPVAASTAVPIAGVSAQGGIQYDPNAR